MGSKSSGNFAIHSLFALLMIGFVATNPLSAQQSIKLTPLKGRLGRLLPEYSQEGVLFEIGNKISVAAFANASGNPRFAESNRKSVLALMDALFLNKSYLTNLPKRKNNQIQDTAAALGYLISEQGCGRKIFEHVLSRYGKREAAFFELGLKSMIAAKLYVKGGTSTLNRSSASAIERASETAGIPTAIYSKYVRDLKEGNVTQKSILDDTLRFHRTVREVLKIKKRTALTSK